ncbi:MAG: tyrosine-type recombinase/integrase [Anaerolineales bacterium]|nr:tyrosine-type recombinase/integrase [Anaerolineales bacterium]
MTAPAAMTRPDSAAARFDYALKHARKRCTAPDRPTPCYSADWPKENIALLDDYRAWLLDGGTGPLMVDQIYVPTAGYALGLSLKPVAEWDLETDLQRALDYIHTRRLSAISTKIRHNALEKFRHFLHQQRGQRQIVFREPDLSRYQAGLPAWLIEALTRYQHLRQASWRPARLGEAIRNFWSNQTRLWRWVLTHYPITSLADVRRQHLFDYTDDRLAAAYSPKSINQDLRAFQGLMLFLQEQDWNVPRALLRVPALKEPAALPRFLTDEQIVKLRAVVEAHVAQAPTAAQRRDALLDRAAFYVMWQGGLRLGEVEELRRDDLDLPMRKLMVRQGKGRKDRAVFLADSAVSALQAYLAVRGPGPSDYVFLYRAEPVEKDLLRSRIRSAGERAGVKVSPHMLRHTFGTQLVNAGCPVTSIQKLLGHRDLSSTLIYARVHDHTVATDYYSAMARIENDLSCTPRPSDTQTRAELLKLAQQLAKPQLRQPARLELVQQLRQILDGQSASP